jgi:hypothetical protein
MEEFYMSQLLFVPGIKGSELYEGNHKRWFPQTMDDLKALCEVEELEAKRPLRLVNAFNVKKVRIYSDFLDAFPTNQLSVFPYDWRKSLFEHVESLVAAIEELASLQGGKGITVIAHSMGGMLSKLAILELAAQGKSNAVKKLITVGTPWRGAPDAFKALAFGEPGLLDGLSSFFPIYTEKHTKDLSRLLPSVYQLLPSQSYFDGEDGDFVIPAEYESFTYQEIVMKVQGFFNEVYKKNEDDKTIDVWKKYMEPLHKEMAKPLPEGIEHDCLIGYGNATLYKIPENKLRNRFKFKGEAIFKNGDGVVPIRSAKPIHEGKNVKIYYLEGQHRNLCCLDQVIEFIKWSIAGKKGAQPSGIIESEEAPVTNELKKGIIAKIACPVDTTILDNEGNYVAGVFDPSIPDISPLAKNNSILYYTFGDSKYMFIREDIKTDLNFEVNAYDTGVADISVRLFDENEVTEIDFAPLSVSTVTSVSLKLPLSGNLQDAELRSDNTYQEKKVRKKPVNKQPITEPIPSLSIEVERAGDNVKKSFRRKIYSGPIKLTIKADNELIEQIFYSIDEGSPIPYKEPVEIDLTTGSHTIRAFGKDIYNRPTMTVEEEVSIDNVAPMTIATLKVDPEGFRVSFAPLSYGSKTNTFYNIIQGEKEHGIKEVEARQEVPVSWSKIDIESPFVIEYYSVNEFGFKEEPSRKVRIQLSDIPHLMWEDVNVALTPKTIWNKIIKQPEFKLDDFIVSLITKGSPEIANDARIPDDVKGVRFQSNYFTLEVMYSEKYSLYFSGPPTEVLEEGQNYNFSFELLSERTKDKVIHTNPQAKLQPIGRKNLPSQRLAVKEKDGVFYSSFKVDKLFLENRYKLVITDDKNTHPPLREISLITRNNE